MLDMRVIVKGLACDCQDVCMVLIMADRYFSRNLGCTTQCCLFGMQHLLRGIIFYMLRRQFCQNMSLLTRKVIVIA